MSKHISLIALTTLSTLSAMSLPTAVSAATLKTVNNFRTSIISPLPLVTTQPAHAQQKAVYGGIFEKWARTGSENGILSNTTKDELPAADDTVFQISQVSRPRTLTATISTRGEVATTIFKYVRGSTYQAIDVNSSGNITRTRRVNLSLNGNFIQIQATDASQDVYRGTISGNLITDGSWYNPNDPTWFGKWTATLEY